MRKLLVLLTVVIYTFSFYSIAFAQEDPENITDPVQAYGTNGDPFLYGAVFLGNFTYNVFSGDDLGMHMGEFGGFISISLDLFTPPSSGIVNFIDDSVLQGAIGENWAEISAVNCDGMGTVQVGFGDSYITTTSINFEFSELNLLGSLTGITLTFTHDGTARLADIANITAAITNTHGVADIGNITTEGTSLITGAVGLTGVGRLGSLAINGVGGKTARITGAVFATDATIGAGELELDSDADITTTTVGAGTLDLDGSLTGTTLTFTDDGTAVLADTKNITAAITNTDGAADNGNITTEGTSLITGAVGLTGVGRLGSLAINGVGGKTARITGAVFATDATIGAGELELDSDADITTTTVGAGTLDLDGSLTGTTLNYTSDGVTTIATGKDITAAITTSANDQGTLTLEGTNTISGQIGTNAARLKALNFNGAGGTTGTLNNDAFATTTTVGGAGTLALTGSLTGTTLNYTADGTATVVDGKTISTNVTTGTNNQGALTFLGTSTTGGTIGAAGLGLAALNINGGTLTLSHDVAATTTTVDSGGTGGTLTLSGNRTITGDLTLANTGTLNLAGTTLTLGGIYTQGENTTLNVTVTDASNFGSISASENAAVNTSSAVDVTVGGNYIAGGSTFTILDGAGGEGVNVPNTITDNSYVLDFTGASSNGDLILTTNRTNSYDTVSTDVNTSAAGRALEENGKTTTDSDMQNILNILDSMGSAKEIEDAIKQLPLDADSGVKDTSLATLDQSIQSVALHLSEIMEGATPGVTGISAGDGQDKWTIWEKGFCAFAEQDRRKGIDGYEAIIWGTIIGIDRLFMDKLTFGVGGGFGQTFLDSKISNIKDTDINSYQSFLYSMYNDGLWHLKGVFSFAYNTYKGGRTISFGTINREADASYHGQQYGGYLSGGYEIPVWKNLKLTPLMSWRYVHLHLNGYTETGAGSLNLKVDDQDYDLLQSGLGLQLACPIELKKGGTLTSKVHGAWLYDFVGDKQETTSTFTGGSASFSTEGCEPAQHSLISGCELKLERVNGISVVGSYDFELKEDFYGHSASIMLRYEF